MCLSKLFELFQPKIKPPSWPHSNRVALLFGINDYGGSENDLRGCLNDIELAADRLANFQVRMFKDRQVTKANFLAQVNYALANALPGDVIYIHYSGHGTFVKDRNGDEVDGYDEALFCYDGPLIDDDLNHALRATPEGVTVVLLLDSCYSGTATRDVFSKGRFLQFEPVKKEHVRVKRKFYDYMSWIVLSGCAENQTSADACIDGRFNGAFSYFAFYTLRGNMTYRQWHAKIREFLPSKDFDQAPTLEGPPELLDKLVFAVEKK